MDYQSTLAISCSCCHLISPYRQLRSPSALRRPSEAPVSVPVSLHLQPMHGPFMPPLFLLGLSISVHGEPCLTRHTILHFRAAAGMEELHHQCVMNETQGEVCVLTRGQVSQPSLPRAGGLPMQQCVAGTLSMVSQRGNTPRVMFHCFLTLKLHSEKVLQ